MVIKVCFYYSTLRTQRKYYHIQVLLIISLVILCDIEGTRRHASDFLSSKERKSLIGHLQDVKSETIVLTERQKLALRQEKQFQSQGFSPFSPRTDPGSERERFSGEK